MTTSSDAPRAARSFRGRPATLLILLIGLAAALLLAQVELVVVTNVHNGELPAASYSLREDDFRHPRLQELRARERLDEVTGGSATQFVAVMRLMHWARSQWEPGADFHYPPWDAVEILDLARRHANHGFCAQYAIVLLQACQSMGIHARYVDLPGHFVVAVWSDDHDRWVLFDPLNEVHYERDGVPMRGRDLYRAFWTKDVRGIEQVRSDGPRAAITPDDLAFYRLYSISMDANQLSTPAQVQVNGEWRTLRRADDWTTYPQVGRDNMVVSSNFLAWRSSDATESFPERPETRDQDEFRYALNQTIVLLANERMVNRILKVALVDGNSPTFGRFLIRSAPGGDWVPAPSRTIKWKLDPGGNDLFARIETTFGWRGPASQIHVFYKPPLFGFLPAFRGNILQLSWHRPAASV